MFTPSNECECGTLDFYFTQLCYTCVFDCMVVFRGLIGVWVVFIILFYREDFFDWIVILFNSRICVCECSVEINCS